MHEGVPVATIKLGDNTIACICDTGSLHLNVASNMCEECDKQNGYYMLTDNGTNKQTYTIVYGSQQDRVITQKDLLEIYLLSGKHSQVRVPFYVTVHRQAGSSNANVMGLLTDYNKGFLRNIVPKYDLAMHIPDSSQTGTLFVLTPAQSSPFQLKMKFKNRIPLIRTHGQPFFVVRVRNITIPPDTDIGQNIYCLIDTGSNMTSLPSRMYEQIIKAQATEMTLHFNNKSLLHIGSKGLMWQGQREEYMLDDDLGVLSSFNKQMMILGAHALQNTVILFSDTHFVF
jgi:hypothetical protein